MAKSICSVVGCAACVAGRGLCITHYNRRLTTGSEQAERPIGAGRPRRPERERFWEKVDKGGPVPAHDAQLGRCWLWTASRNHGGYGFFRSYVDSQAHRWSYIHAVGQIPEGMFLDHLCRERSCVNPAHLEPVTNRENILRGQTFAARQAAQTHCVHGHEFDDANTRITPRGKRDCRACIRNRVAATRAKKKASQRQE